MDAVTLIMKYGKSVTLKRQSVAGSYVNRIFVPGVPAPSTIVMSIQPIDGETLMNMPEAQRTREFVKGYTATQLFTSDQSAMKKADLIIDGAKTYEVQKVEPWESTNNNIQPFWKVIMARANP